MRERSALAGQRAGEAAAAHRHSDRLLALLARHVPGVIWTADRELRFTASLGRALTELGLGAGEVVGRSLYDYFGTTDPDFPPIAAHRRALAGDSQTFEWIWKERQFEVYLEPLRETSGEVSGVLGLAVDVTERVRAESERLASEQRYRSLFENAHDVVFMLDLAGNFLAVNRAAERVSGYRRQELLGMNITQLLDSGAARYVSERIQRALGGETHAEFELPIRARDGRQVYLEVSARLEFTEGLPSAIQGIARDVTERKRLEEQLREAQKTEAIGALAAGVAHELNNVLTAILGYTDLLRKGAGKGDLVGEAAEVIHKAAERARQIALGLLGLARRGKARDTAVDLHALLREITALLGPSLSRNITLLEHYDAPAAVTRGDCTQLHQALLNLALNALEAMPQGGTLMLRTELVTVTAETYRDLGVAAPGPYVKVSITDTGRGIAPEHLPHLFEPFFTTKAQSSGLGLAVVHGVVKNHGGAVRVLSRPGQGSTFEVYLPLVENAAPSRSRLAEPGPAGAGAVLVVDDDAAVALAAVRLLERLGYEAVFLTDGAQALEVLRQEPEAFRLVVADMVMPGMSGEEFLRGLKAFAPDLPVIMATGYAGEGAGERVREAGAAGYLAKPYTLDQLREAVRQALGE